MWIFEDLNASLVHLKSILEVLMILDKSKINIDVQIRNVERSRKHNKRRNGITVWIRQLK